VAKVLEPKSLTVKQFFSDNAARLKLERLSVKGDNSRFITEASLHRPGLAFAEFVDGFPFQRIQLCGNTETAYLQKLETDQLEKILRRVFSFNIPCFIFTNNNAPSNIFLQLADENDICVFQTHFPTTQATQVIGNLLLQVFAPRINYHGTLVDVYGVGILLTGRSGIGKTEVALDLVKRGHRLVADDVVSIMKRAGDFLIGSGNKMLRHNMEIRGVGILDVQAVYGIRGIRMKKRIESLVELKDWDETEVYERLGLDERTVAILDVAIPKLELAVYPGKSIAVIVEVIALNHLLKLYGFHSAERLEARMTDMKSDDYYNIYDSMFYDNE